MSMTIADTHLGYVRSLRERGEEVLQPRFGKPMGYIDGYIKTQIPHKDAGSIFQDKEGTFGLFGDMGALRITGIKWEDLGLCDTRCWYEWMNPDTYEEEAYRKYAQPSVQNALNIRATEVWRIDEVHEAFIEEAAEAIQAVTHFRRCKCDKDTLFGEMADLQIMLDQMKVLYGPEEFNTVLAGKYAALDRKIDVIEKGDKLV